MLDKGEFLLRQNKFSEAEDIITLAKSKLEKENNKAGLAKAMTLLSRSYIGSRKQELAKSTLNILSDIVQVSNNELSIADYYQVKGEYHFAVNEFDEALNNFSSALVRHEVAGDQMDVAKDKIWLYKIAVEKGEKDLSIKLMGEIKSISEILDNRAFKNQIEEILANV